MTEEEVRDLLLSDLCGRLPYGVKLHCTWHMYQEEKEAEDVGVLFSINYIKKEVLAKRKFLRTRFPVNRDGCKLKPYLRPMSSMTDYEKEELRSEFGADIRDEDNGKHTETYGYVIVYHNFKGESWYIPFEAIDWLNAHHFDYRGLIEKGLALEAPEGMY